MADIPPHFGRHNCAGDLGHHLVQFPIATARMGGGASATHSPGLVRNGLRSFLLNIFTFSFFLRHVQAPEPFDRGLPSPIVRHGDHEGTPATTQAKPMHCAPSRLFLCPSARASLERGRDGVGGSESPPSPNLEGGRGGAVILLLSSSSRRKKKGQREYVK